MLIAGAQADAQICSVTPNYKAANPPTPAQATPAGTYSLPATPDSWRVKVDYGTWQAGAFVFWKASTTGSVAVISNPMFPINNNNWGPMQPDVLAGAPAGLKVQAILQKKVNNVWTDVHVAYADCP